MSEDAQIHNAATIVSVDGGTDEARSLVSPGRAIISDLVAWVAALAAPVCLYKAWRWHFQTPQPLTLTTPTYAYWIVGGFTLVPPVYFWWHWMFCVNSDFARQRPEYEAYREKSKQMYDLSRNIWVALIGALAFLFNLPPFKG